VDVWALEATKRGCAVEDALALTDYKGWTRSSEFELKDKDGKWRKPGKVESQYFPRVDFHKPGTLEVVSLKTMETRGREWEKDLQEYVDSHSPYDEVTIRKDGKGKWVPANLTLDVRVPKDAKKVQAAADKMLAKAEDAAKKKHQPFTLQVKVKEYP
jgi:hypothetical protein